MGIDLKSSKIISLDTNIFIRALDDSTNLGDRARELIAEIRETVTKVFISTILLEEFFVRVYKEKLEKEEADILDFLTIGGLGTFVNMDQRIALLAAKIRADYPSVKGPDAIHLASAIEVGAKIFITTDRRLPQKIGKLTIQILS
ncbi:PIN domain-containing protein [Candidatus Daviesbacteria bacterium]|nr:PIN domain-containing protein [Candidatus Daviesbacteria bacterium]